jgi:hypothetical protein
VQYHIISQSSGFVDKSGVQQGAAVHDAPQNRRGGTSGRKWEFAGEAHDSVREGGGARRRGDEVTRNPKRPTIIQHCCVGIIKNRSESGGYCSH